MFCFFLLFFQYRAAESERKRHDPDGELNRRRRAKIVSRNYRTTLKRIPLSAQI